MAIYKVTHSRQYRRATVHNAGCNFRCRGCSYKLKGNRPPERFLPMAEVQACLRGLDVDAVHFMGGEPTTNPQLPELLAFCKHELKRTTRLGHSNGSRLVVRDLDASNVSFKAFDDDLHRDYTGHPAAPVYENFRQAHAAGLSLRASAVLIPGYTGLEQLRKIAAFVAGVDAAIPFHVMGYIPVPGTPWRRPTEEEMEEAVALVRQYLVHVNSSHLTAAQALGLEARDDRFAVQRVL